MTEEQFPLCECGCGKPVAKMGNRFILGHNKGRFGTGKPKSPSQLCECGCGKLTNFGCRFINGHENRGKCNSMYGVSRVGEDSPNYGNKHTEESKEKIRNSAIGRFVSDVTREKVSKNHADVSGENNPMYGICGGKDIVNHHYIYDHNDLSLNVIQITRSDHTKLHALLRKLKYIIPNIEICE